MKKTILTTLTICAFVITNAQVKTKANHNTTRSNRTNGIMVKEEGKDNDCDGIIDSKLFIKMTKSGTPDLHLHCCNAVKKSWEDATASAVKEASKKAHAKKHLFTNKGVTYYYNGDLGKLGKCKTQLKRDKWIAIESSFRHSSETKRKRNKNFNRKGERVKRTKF